MKVMFVRKYFRLKTQDIKKLYKDELFKREFYKNIFTHSYALAIHKRTHTGDKTLWMHVIFLRKYLDLKYTTRHKQNFTNDELFKREVYLNRFTHSNALARRMRTHAGDKTLWMWCLQEKISIWKTQQDIKLY